MSNFAMFCPKCWAFFRDPDAYARHFAVCGTAQAKDAVKTPKTEPKKTPETKPENKPSPEPEPAQESTADAEDDSQSADDVEEETEQQSKPLLPKRGRPPKIHPSR